MFSLADLNNPTEEHNTLTVSLSSPPMIIKDVTFHSESSEIHCKYVIRPFAWDVKWVGTHVLADSVKEMIKLHFFIDNFIYYW